MKNLMLRHNRGMVLALAVLSLSFLAGGATQVLAHGNDYDRDGYRDRDGYYRHYETYHNHRGYWNQRSNGVRFFISVG